MIQVASRLHEIRTIDSDFMVYRLPSRSSFRVITNNEQRTITNRRALSLQYNCGLLPENGQLCR